MRVLKGKVASGMGNFSYWIEKLSDHYLQKTGMRLFPGTLNVHLAEEYCRPKAALRLEKEEYAGTVSVSIIPCEIFGRKAYILRTDKAEQEAESRRIIEIATDVKLRSTYRLNDNDGVEVTVEN